MATFAALAGLLDGRTPKVYRGTSARALPPEQTWARVQPLLRPCGITRVANITGLDRVGLPVYQAIRPNSRSLSVSQGKGADAMAARISAVMEAIELHFAESPPLALRLASYAELQGEGLAANPEELPHTAEYDPARRMLWTQGYELLSRQSIWVPFDLVHINLIEPAGSLLVTSNGLASGNTLAEAVFHGLCEVVERDAEALFRLGSTDAQNAALLDLSSVSHPEVRALLQRLAEAGLTPVAWNLTSDIALPAIRVFLYDAHADSLVNPVSAPYGAGCHFDASTALLRALTESAQTRVSWIAGSRDDLSRDHYRRSHANTAYLAELLRLPTPARLSDLPCRALPTLEEDVAHVLSALSAVGIRQVAVVPLSGPDCPVAIARVIVPGLEGPALQERQLGRRARAVAS